MGKGDPDGGRPRVEIDMKMLANLCRIQATAEECAGVLDCSVDTIDRRLKEEGHGGFADFFEKHSAEGRASLRRQQFKTAEAGNATMQIWLGKQWLGQTDKVVNEHTGKDGGDIKVAAQLDFTRLSTAALKELEGVLAKDDPSTDD